MKRFGQSSRALRIVVGAIALYALFLHGFMAAAAPIATVNSSAHVSSAHVDCSHEASRAPADKDRRHHGHCCIFCCASCGAAYGAIIAGVVVLPARASSAIAWTMSPTAASAAALKLCSRARGPPQTA